MRKIIGVLALLALVGCSSSGGGGIAGGQSSGTTAPSSPSSSSTSSGSAAQKPVPAENNPPGDIPDNLAFVAYRSSGGYSFKHPEGWAQQGRGTTVIFTDKLNGVQVAIGSFTSAPTTASARSQDVPALTSSQAAFQLRSISAVTEPAGVGVRIVYRRNSAPDPVTGRQYRDEVQRYELFSHGHAIVMELFGPVGADNVDAYRTMIQSLRLP